MTWYAKELIFNATDKARSIAESIPKIRQHLYQLTDPVEHDWPGAEFKHLFSPEGLIFVRPICSPSHAHAFEWFEEDNPLSPHDLPFAQTKPGIDMGAVKTALGFSGEDISAIEPAIRFAKHFSQHTGETILYYDTFFWGGLIEYELAWVFSDKETVFIKGQDSGSNDIISKMTATETETINGDALRMALAELECIIPSPYFAPHTRDFPWPHYKI